jgi:protein-S-isoprenylcysteine O-methyltransferase Ste14
MEVVDRRIFGIIIILLWLMLVIVKKVATGSLLGDKPNGGVLFWLIHIFNFSFLLVANPVAAVLLIAPGKGAIAVGSMLTMLSAAGTVFLGFGNILMAWALLTLRRNYQVGGNPPRGSDELVVGGPYRFVRHPMYAAAVPISLGLACLTRHVAYFLVFFIYVVLVLLLMPIEEQGLEKAYGQRYAAYKKSVKRLIPALY